MRHLYFKVIALFFLGLFAKNYSQNVNINWNTIEGQVPDKIFGLNIWDGTLNGINNDLEYKTAMSELNLSIVRFHAYEMTVNSNIKSWYDTSTQNWRNTVIDGCLEAQSNVPNKMISIFNFPQWLSNDGIDVKNMNVSNAQVYADWCANLVQIVNIDLAKKVKYWSVFNELESNYNGNIADLATIYLTCYAKMKLIDPTIQIGAFAISQPWWNNSAQYDFYRLTKNNLDFIDYHLYGGENTAATNNLLYNDATFLGYGGVDNVRSIATSAGVSLSVPIWLSETNMTYTFTNDPDGKMKSNVGAVWDALLFESAIKSKAISSIMLFNDRDGVYGKLAPNNAKRPAYHNLKILSNNFYGSIVNTTTTDTDVKILAVKGASYNSVMICNRSLVDKTINVSFTNGPANGMVYKNIELKNTIIETDLNWNNAQNYSIPSESMIYLIFRNSLGIKPVEKKADLIFLESTVVNANLIKLNSAIETNTNMIVNDLTGKKILELKNQKLNRGSNTVDLSGFNFNKGIYILKIDQENNTSYSFKIVFNY